MRPLRLVVRSEGKGTGQTDQQRTVGVHKAPCALSVSVVLSCRWSEHECCSPMPNECRIDCGLSVSTQFGCTVLKWLCNPVVLPPSVGSSFAHSLHCALAPPATLVKCFHTSDLFLRVDIVFTLLKRYRLLASN